MRLAFPIVLPALPKLDQPFPPPCVRVPKSRLCARRFPVERGIRRPLLTGGGCEFDVKDDEFEGGEDERGGDEERRLRFNERKADSSCERRDEGAGLVMIGKGTVLVECSCGAEYVYRSERSASQSSRMNGTTNDRTKRFPRREISDRSVGCRCRGVVPFRGRRQTRIR